VTDYIDHAHGEMEERRDGGHFTSVVLRSRVTITSSGQLATATELHEAPHRACFIATSVNFAVRCEPTTTSS